MKRGKPKLTTIRIKLSKSEAALVEKAMRRTPGVVLTDEWCKIAVINTARAVAGGAKLKCGRLTPGGPCVREPHPIAFPCHDATGGQWGKVPTQAEAQAWLEGEEQQYE